MAWFPGRLSVRFPGHDFAGLDDTYVVERMKSLTLHPEFSGERYEWKLSYESTAADSLVATPATILCRR